MAPPPERAAEAIHCLRVDCRGHIRPLVRDNLAGGSGVVCPCATALCAGYMVGGCADPGIKTPSVSIQISKQACLTKQLF